MSATYLFRLDDISWNMNIEKFHQLRDLFFQYDVRPLIGIIPNNEDRKLKSQIGTQRLSKEMFWEEMRDLQQNHKWTVALHGYNHVYTTTDSGIFKINRRSEFAGLPFAEQNQKIRDGKDILEKNGLTVNIFMAPAHSLDCNTLEALKQNNIYTVTDGYACYPFEKNGILFIPQVWPWPWWSPCGIMTSCFHVNIWESTRFEKFNRFLARNMTKCGTWPDVITAAKNDRNAALHSMVNRAMVLIVKIEKPLMDFVFKLKNMLRTKG